MSPAETPAGAENAANSIGRLARAQLALANDGLPTVDQPPPRSAIDLLVPGGLPSIDLDPLADGILMAHQSAWVADQSPLKLAVKGRRTGFTFGEALDSTLWAAAKRSAGGDNTWYIGDTKEKGLEFIGVCARFARHVAKELLTVEEFLFEDTLPDGSSKAITAYRIRFASGFQIAALSSRPANIRGLQGRVVIDEAAFHADVRGVIDACNALLIWGGVIRIISTHNGVANAFNDLIKETEAGKTDYKVHRATFDDAVANGLYERVCLIKGESPTVEGKEAWYRRIRRSYGTRTEAMREELDAIPREGDGVALPLAWIERAASPECHVVRWEAPASDFVDWPETARRATMQLWLERQVRPHLEALAATGLPTALGEDFGMRQDRTTIVVGYTAQDLRRVAKLIVELRTCPYDQQRQALFYVADSLRRFQGGILDANGNGMALAQEARQRYGPERIVELMPSDAWLREHGPAFRSAFEDGTILIPADLDIRNDLQQLRTIGGVIKVPRSIRTEGTDGGKRHADAAVGLFNFFVATRGAYLDYGYEACRPGRGAFDERDDDDNEAGGILAGIKGAW